MLQASRLSIVPSPGYPALLRTVALLICLTTAPATLADASPLRITKPEQRPAVDRLLLTGSLVAPHQANLSPRVDGLVADLNVEVGDRVNAGDLILRLDDTLEAHTLQQYDAEVAAMRAQVRENQRLVDEAQRLTREKHLPQSELALRRAQLDTAQAQLEGALAKRAGQATRLAWHQVTAPFSGVIHRRLTERGEWVTRGTPVVELVALTPLYLDVQVPQERITELSPGDPVTLHPDALPGTTLTGQVAVIVPVSDPQSRSFRVRIQVDAEPGRLLPGTSARAEFNLSSAAKTALIVPRDAILRNPDGQFSVFTVNTQAAQPTAQRQVVQLGQQTGTGVEVLQGLTLDSAVVIRGNEILRDGQAVRILP